MFISRRRREMRAAGVSAFTPASLFTGGVGGAFYDFTDPLTLFSDVARTTPAVLNGPVRGVLDLSGNGRNLATATTTILMRAGHVELPGGVVGFTTLPDPTGSAAGWTSAMAFRPDVVAGTQRWIDCDLLGQRVAQSFFQVGAVQSALALTSSGAQTATDSGGMLAGADYAGVNICTTAAITLRRNKVQTGQLTYAALTPTSSASCPIGIGSGWAGTPTQNMDPVDGRAYVALFINRVLTAQEIADLEAWMYAKAGLAAGGLGIDMDGDGLLDTRLTADGVVPIISVDADSINIDTDGDGDMDVQVPIP